MLPIFSGQNGNPGLNVAVADQGLASRFLRDFEQDLTRSQRLNLDTWRKRPMIDKVREQFWGIFAEVF